MLPFPVVHTGNGTIKLGSFPGDDSPRILLRLSNHQTLQLLVVIPHHLPPVAASTAVAAASSPRNVGIGSGTAYPPARHRPDADPSARWIDDSGNSVVPSEDAAT